MSGTGGCGATGSGVNVPCESLVARGTSTPGGKMRKFMLTPAVMAAAVALAVPAADAATQTSRGKSSYFLVSSTTSTAVSRPKSSLRWTTVYSSAPRGWRRCR